MRIAGLAMTMLFLTIQMMSSAHSDALRPVTITASALHGSGTGGAGLLPVTITASALHGSGMGGGELLPVTITASALHGSGMGGGELLPVTITTTAMHGFGTGGAGLLPITIAASAIHGSGTVQDREVRSVDVVLVSVELAGPTPYCVNQSRNVTVHVSNRNQSTISLNPEQYAVTLLVTRPGQSTQRIGPSIMPNLPPNGSTPIVFNNVSLGATAGALTLNAEVALVNVPGCVDDASNNRLAAPMRFTIAAW